MYEFSEGYFVTRDGRVFTKWRRGRHYWRGPIFPLKEVKRTLLAVGYLRVSVGPGSSRYVHELVLEAFVGARPAGQRYEARHLNGKKRDNHVENLCWGTVVENQRDRIAHGTSNRGERNGMSRLTIANVRRIKHLLGMAASPRRVIAEEYGVGVSTIDDIKHERTWQWV